MIHQLCISQQPEQLIVPLKWKIKVSSYRPNVTTQTSFVQRT